MPRFAGARPGESHAPLGADSRRGVAWRIRVADPRHGLMPRANTHTTVDICNGPWG